jgi:hypothetical protein
MLSASSCRVSTWISPVWPLWVRVLWLSPHPFGLPLNSYFRHRLSRLVKLGYIELLKENLYRVVPDKVSGITA